jgi:hypothetical protein
MTFSFEVKTDGQGTVSLNGLKYSKETAIKIARNMLAALEHDAITFDSLPWMRQGTLDEFQKPWRPLST